MDSSKFQSPTILVSFALFVVWMERQGRWTLFFSAITGDAVLTGARGSGTTGSSSGPTGGGNSAVSGNTTPNNAPANSTRNTVVGGGTFVSPGGFGHFTIGNGGTGGGGGNGAATPVQTINLGPGSGQAVIPSVGGGPPAPTF